MPGRIPRYCFVCGRRLYSQESRCKRSHKKKPVCSVCQFMDKNFV